MRTPFAALGEAPGCAGRELVACLPAAGVGEECAECEVCAACEPPSNQLIIVRRLVTAVRPKRHIENMPVASAGKKIDRSTSAVFSAYFAGIDAALSP